MQIQILLPLHPCLTRVRAAQINNHLKFAIFFLEQVCENICGHLRKIVFILTYNIQIVVNDPINRSSCSDNCLLLFTLSIDLHGFTPNQRALFSLIDLSNNYNNTAFFRVTLLL